MTNAKYRRQLGLLARRFGRRLEFGRHCHLTNSSGHKVFASGTPRCPDIALRATERLLEKYS